MEEESNSQNATAGATEPPDDSQLTNEAIAPSTGGRKVLQPSESAVQEIQAQKRQEKLEQAVGAQTPQPAQQDQQPEITQATPQETPASIYPATVAAQIQPGMSASQLGLNEPKNKFFDLNPKQLLIKGSLTLVVLGMIFAGLVMTNIIALSEFKSIGYSNSEKTNFQLDFYTKHNSKKLKSGNNQLTSKVSKDGKFPITLSIAPPAEISGYNKAKGCNGFDKAFDVQNDILNQKISVCDFGTEAKLPADSVYIAGFMHNDQAYIITIGQDYGDIDLSSQSDAKESLTKFGMEPYKADIERILSSIEVK